MTNYQIKQIGYYQKTLNRLNIPHSSPISFQAELPISYETIKLLMDKTFKTKDIKLKTLLAYMEMRSKKCWELVTE